MRVRTDAASSVMLPILLVCALLLVLLSALFPLWGQAPDRKVLYVDPQRLPGGSGASWKDACASLQEALELAPEGAEIWCAAGELGRAEANVSCRLYGGFAGTEHSREERNWVVRRSVLPALEASAGVVLDGFWGKRKDDAVFAFSGKEDFEIRNCRFEGLRSPGPLLSFSGCGRVDLENCFIVDCVSGLERESSLVEVAGCGQAYVGSCTLAGNVSGDGAILSFSGTAAGVFNSILWNPGIPEVVSDWRSCVVVFFCNLEDSTGNDGIPSPYPVFHSSRTAYKHV